MPPKAKDIKILKKNFLYGGAAAPPAPFIFSFSVSLGFGAAPFEPLGNDAPFFDDVEDNKPEGESGEGAVLFTIRIFWTGLRNGREADGGGGAGLVVVVELVCGVKVVDWALVPAVGGECWTWSLSFKGGGRSGMGRGGMRLVRIWFVFWKRSVAWQNMDGERCLLVGLWRKGGWEEVNVNFLLTFPVLVHFQYRGYFKLTIMLDSDVYNISQISRSCPSSLKLIVGEEIASQSFSLNTSLLPISTFKAFNAPATVCFRAKSAFRASVDASCSIMRPSG